MSFPVNNHGAYQPATIQGHVQVGTRGSQPAVRVKRSQIPAAVPPKVTVGVSCVTHGPAVRIEKK